MTKKRKTDSVFREAWENMSEDFNKFMPEKLRGTPGKKKFVLWLFICEIVAFGVIGKLLYSWLLS